MNSDYNAFVQVPLRRMLAVLAMLAFVVGCASTPDEAPEPEEEQVRPEAIEQEREVREAPEEARPETEPEPEPEPEVRVAERAPRTYVVKKGDTLWDIAAQFLRDPWLWPEVWHINPELDNPHLIYPGDVLTLGYVEGRPRVRRRDPQDMDDPGVVEEVRRVEAQEEREGREGREDRPRVQVRDPDYPTVRLEPRIREEPIEAAVPTMPLSAVRSFLDETRIVDQQELDEAAYVLRSVNDARLLSSAGERIYVRGLNDTEERNYHIVRPGEEFTDPDSGDVLGREARFIGEARIQEFSDPSIAQLRRVNQEVRRGDLLLPVPLDEFRDNFMPRPPAEDVNGRIISVFDSTGSNIGQYQVVTLNRGSRDGLEPGNVLVIMQEGGEYHDERGRENVELPDQRAGELMVFRTYDRISYALVMRASRAVRLQDSVISP